MRLIHRVRRLYGRCHNDLITADPLEAPHVHVGCDVYVARGAQFLVPRVVIGDHSRINGPIRMIGFHGVAIGKYCALGSSILMITSNHVTSHASLQVTMLRRLGLDELAEDRGPICIGHNVWIGDEARLLAGCSVGDGAVIGTASVVTKNIPAFAIAVGSPARVIRYRFSEEVSDALLSIAWWHWPEDRIQRNRDFFKLDLTQCTARQIHEAVVD